MSITKWYPKTSLLQQLQHDLWDVLATDNRHLDTMSQWLPKIDIQEKDKAFIVSLEVPGVSPKDIEVNMEGNKLMVKGEKKHTYENSAQGVYRMERNYGSFYREFTLPKTVNGENIQATCQHGVLTLEIPKAEKSVSRQIAIEEI